MSSRLYISSIRALDNPGLYERAYLSASSQRKEKVDRLRSEEDRKRSLMAEILLQKALNDQHIDIPELRYGYNEYGKPYLPDQPEFHFNISHAKEYVICVFSDEEAGCDIEKIRKYDLNVAKRFFAPDEYEQLLSCSDEQKRAVLFFRYWTLKESYLKFKGGGLSIPLNSFSFEIDDDKVTAHVLEEDLFFIESDIIKGYRISICSYDEKIPFEWIDPETLL